MTGKFTVEQKYEILMESLNSDESIAEICRKHGVAPVNFRKWRERFLEGGKKALAEGPLGNEYEKRIDELTKIIGEQTLVINELKKHRQGGDRDDVP